MSLRRRPIRTFTTLAIVTGLLLGILITPAAARPPSYGQGFVATPSPVSYGGQVRFDVTWTNTSGSNLPTVFVKADSLNGSELVGLIGLPSQGTCNASDPTVFTCAFGTVNNQASVDFSVVYQVPSSGASPFNVKFVFTAQGNTGADTPGKSRGDDMPVTVSVPLTNDPESGSSYVFDDAVTVQNNQTLNKRNNLQSAKMTFSLAPGSDGFGASVKEKAAGDFTCPTELTTCFGNWNDLTVNDGLPVPGGFTLVLGYVSTSGNANTVNFVHLLGGTAFDKIDKDCAYDAGSLTPNNMPCIDDISSTQGYTYYTLILGHNGQVRAY